MASFVRSTLTHHDMFWRRFLRRWKQHRHTDNAAALTFYSLVSLVPVLLIGVAVSGSVLGTKTALGELEKQLSATVGGGAAHFINGVLESSQLKHGNPLAVLVILAGLFYAGSHVLARLRESLNIINGAEPGDPARPWLNRLLSRGLCALMLLAFGVLLVVSTALEGFVAYFASHVDTPFISTLNMIKGYQLVSSYILLALMFFIILKILPRRRPPVMPAVYGAVASALVVGSLKGGMDLYMQRSPLASIFGTAITIMVFLYWMFLSVQAFLAGAEITAMLTAKRGGMLLGKKLPHKDS